MVHSDDTEGAPSDDSDDEAEFTDPEEEEEEEEDEPASNPRKRKLSVDDRLYKRTLDRVFLYPAKPLEGDDSDKVDDTDYQHKDPDLEDGDEEVVRNYARILRERNTTVCKRPQKLAKNKNA